MDSKVITLPGPDDMLRRLKAVSDDNQWVNHFYPLLIQKANRSVTGPDVVTMLMLAIIAYRRLTSPAPALPVMRRIADFIEALIDDREVRTAALTRWEEIQGSAPPS